MSNIKILYLVPHLENKGPVSQLYYLLKYMNLNKFNPVILTFFSERENSLVKDFEGLGIRIIRLNLKRYQMFKEVRLLRQAIRLEKPDIIHSNSDITDIICNNIKTDIPIITTQHNYIYDDLPKQYGRVIGKILCREEKKFMRKATCVITCSETINNLYHNRYFAIPNGIEINKWSKCSLNKSELRKKLGLPENKHIYISTSLLLKRKDPELIVKAFALSGVKNSILVMLGDGSELGACRAMAGRNVRFVGRVNNVKEFLYASDTLISASKSEGLPYAILEAECTGIRMILSNIPQHKEVTNNSSDVLFFECSDLNKLSELILKTENDGSRTTYDLEKFSANGMSRSYQKKYLELIGENEKCLN